MQNKLTDEARNQIIDLWQLGHSGGEIAEQMGLTRNSIIGYISRQRANGVLLRSARKERIMPVKPPKRILSILERKVPVGDRRRLKIHELESKSCRFIVTPIDAPVLYCGAPMVDRSYCKEHLAICYTPVKRR